MAPEPCVDFEIRAETEGGAYFMKGEYELRVEDREIKIIKETKKGTLGVNETNYNFQNVWKKRFREIYDGMPSLIKNFIETEKNIFSYLEEDWLKIPYREQNIEGEVRLPLVAYWRLSKGLGIHNPQVANYLIKKGVYDKMVSTAAQLYDDLNQNNKVGKISQPAGYLTEFKTKHREILDKFSKIDDFSSVKWNEGYKIKEKKHKFLPAFISGKESKIKLIDDSLGVDREGFKKLYQKIKKESYTHYARNDKERYGVWRAMLARSIMTTTLDKWAEEKAEELVNRDDVDVDELYADLSKKRRGSKLRRAKNRVFRRSKKVSFDAGVSDKVLFNELLKNDKLEIKGQGKAYVYKDTEISPISGDYAKIDFSVGKDNLGEKKTETKKFVKSYLKIAGTNYVFGEGIDAESKLVKGLNWGRLRKVADKGAYAASAGAGAAVGAAGVPAYLALGVTALAPLALPFALLAGSSVAMGGYHTAKKFGTRVWNHFQNRKRQSNMNASYAKA